MQNRAPQKAEQVYELLRRSIIMLDLAPGAPVVEKNLCAELSMSRTPVREAVQRLADEGLVHVISHSGTYVSHISFEVAEEGFVIRRALEIESVRRAATVAEDAGAELNPIVSRMRALVQTGHLHDYLDEDDAFHAAIARLSRMPRIWRFITLAKVHLDRMRQLSAPVPGHLAMVTEQHAAIAAAVAAGKADQAELAMRIHLESSFDVMAKLHHERTGMFLSEDT
ncbi:GntR family transcriptional regulator [Falsirhodobacter sp. 20TX0035]|uniref:GntR family transcriptional regulator n=1 Tax=Falsirhodobacter sp. 20TX0035 TaxID=3022019 RepID=UPI00232B1A7B|nr:GntR family transcriptional regulator [Falsirhodobacter sp. 20TX0035]MDB6454084.1 GntR family transcriptional regulator [Falsirhodobacter sp. 20TX0035]